MNQVEPIQPTLPMELMEPVEPVESAETVEAGNPTITADEDTVETGAPMTDAAEETADVSPTASAVGERSGESSDQTIAVVEPTEPVAAMEPAEPLELADPLEPLEPLDPMDSMEPRDPMEPVELVEPQDPMESEEPLEPLEPADLMGPTEPFYPATDDARTSMDMDSYAPAAMDLEPPAPVLSARSVVLINPPSAPQTTANREGAGGLGVLTAGPGGFVYPPQTLAAVAASLREAEYEVMALDGVGEELDLEQILARLGEATAAATIGVLVSPATLQADMRFINALAQAMPDVSIFLFGAGLRHVWHEALQGSEAALAILGEAEFDTPAVVEALASGRSYPLHRLDGIAYWVNGEIVHRPAASLYGDLDMLPYPAWDLLPHDRYSFLTLSGSRGCDHECAYCPYVAAQGGFRARSPESVAAEARWLQRTFDVPRLVFRDPVFAADRDRTLELCRALRKARVRVGWECESRPEHFDPDLLYQMRRSGCQVVKLGLETVDDTLLWGVNRLLPGWTAARYRAHVAELVATCGRLGLRCRVFVMTGLPGQTVAALERTLAFLQALQAPAVSVKRYQAYPGTLLGEGAGAAVGYPLLSEAELERLENAMRAAAAPLPPPRRSLLRRLVRRRGRE